MLKESQKRKIAQVLALGRVVNVRGTQGFDIGGLVFLLGWRGAQSMERRANGTEPVPGEAAYRVVLCAAVWQESVFGDIYRDLLIQHMATETHVQSIVNCAKQFSAILDIQHPCVEILTILLQAGIFCLPSSTTRVHVCAAWHWYV